MADRDDGSDPWDDSPGAADPDDDSAGETDTPQDEGRVRCAECGASLNRYSKFCRECGAQQDFTGVDDEQSRQRGERGQRRQRGRNRQQGGEQYGGQRGGGQYGPPERQVTAGPNSDTGMAAIAHVLALFLGLLGPILIYAITDDPFVKQNAANATNWQIMLIVYSVISLFLALLLVGFLFLIALVFMDIAFIIIAAIKASDGEAWEYPLTPELL